MASKAKTALLCAYTLAHAKQYAEAEALILSHEELAKTPEAIDLLARIRMEEGDEAEARRLWQGILSIYPENAAARAALKVIGKRPLRIKWVAVLAAALPLVFFMGAFIGEMLIGRPHQTVITWENIPTQEKINQLASYKKDAQRVCIASRFFSDPSKTFSRELLTGAISRALDLPSSAIFIGDATEDLGETAIRVELLR